MKIFKKIKTTDKKILQIFGLNIAYKKIRKCKKNEVYPLERIYNNIIHFRISKVYILTHRIIYKYIF